MVIIKKKIRSTKIVFSQWLSLRKNMISKNSFFSMVSLYFFTKNQYVKNSFSFSAYYIKMPRVEELFRGRFSILVTDPITGKKKYEDAGKEYIMMGYFWNNHIGSEVCYQYGSNVIEKYFKCLICDSDVPDFLFKKYQNMCPECDMIKYILEKKNSF